MARTNAVLGAGARLSDFLSASLLARVYPAAMIGEILVECASHGILAANLGHIGKQSGRSASRC